jgi:hypothetical protein
MFREIELTTFQVEAILDAYVLRADMQPRGDLGVYINDRNWDFIPFQNAELLPLSVERRVEKVRRAQFVVNKHNLAVLSVLGEEQADQVQLLSATRAVVLYTSQFAVKGQLHVNTEAPQEDLLAELHDYHGLTKATVYPLREVATAPTASVPLLFVRRQLVQAYHAQE